MAEQGLAKLFRRLQGRHWRVQYQGFSFNADRALFRLEYRSRLGFWRALSDPNGIGFVCATSDQEAANLLKEHADPKSVTPSGVLPRAKPRDWNNMQYLTGQYGKARQYQAILGLAASLPTTDPHRP